MKNNKNILNEINRARQIWDYDKSKTIFEQASGTEVMWRSCNGSLQGSSYTCVGSQYGSVGSEFRMTLPGMGDRNVYVLNVGGPCNSPVQTSPVTGPCTNNQAQSWWCDPTGAYVNANGGNCVQSPNQPQSYFTGPYPSEADCNANCATTGGPTGTTNTGTTNTGTTGGPTPTGGPMVPTINFCSGGTHTPHYGVTLNGQNLTQGDIGKTIIWSPGAMFGYSSPVTAQGTITSIGPTTPGYGVAADSNEQACPNTGGPSTGTTGTTQFPNNFNPSSWFSTFLSNASSKPWYASRKCQFFANRIQLWTNQLQGAGPRKQNMLNAKINAVTMYAQQQPTPGCTNI